MLTDYQLLRGVVSSEMTPSPIQGTRAHWFDGLMNINIMLITCNGFSSHQISNEFMYERFWCYIELC